MSAPPPRPTSPFQPYARGGHGGPPGPPHSSHAAPGAWSVGRSPELEGRSALAYRRRSASVDEGIDRDKVKEVFCIQVFI